MTHYKNILFLFIASYASIIMPSGQPTAGQAMPNPTNNIGNSAFMPVQEHNRMMNYHIEAANKHIIGLNEQIKLSKQQKSFLEIDYQLNQSQLQETKALIAREREARAKLMVKYALERDANQQQIQENGATIHRLTTQNSQLKSKNKEILDELQNFQAIVSRQNQTIQNLVEKAEVLTLKSKSQDHIIQRYSTENAALITQKQELLTIVLQSTQLLALSDSQAQPQQLPTIRIPLPDPNRLQYNTFPAATSSFHSNQK